MLFAENVPNLLSTFQQEDFYCHEIFLCETSAVTEFLK